MEGKAQGFAESIFSGLSETFKSQEMV